MIPRDSRKKPCGVSRQSSVASRQSSETAATENCQLNPDDSGVAGPANLTLSTETIELSDAIEARALTLENRGFKAFDALHIASAEAGRVEYFCSCDDRLLKKARGQLDLMTKVVSPLELAKDLYS